MIRKILALLIWPSVISAQNIGTSSFTFTQVPISTISSALGGNQIAINKSDVLQVADNPAFADTTMTKNVTFSYLNFINTINQAAIGYAFKPQKLGIFSSYLRYYDYGSFTETDALGNSYNKFGAADYEIAFNLTRFYRKNIAYGFTFKQLFSSMHQYFAYGLGFDAGVYYHSDSKNFSAGIVINNAGLKLIDYTHTNNEFLPLEVNIAANKKFQNAPIRIGLQYNHLERWDLAAIDNDALKKTKVDPITKETSRPIYTADNLVRHLVASFVFEPSPKFNAFVGYNFRRRLELSAANRPGAVGFSFGFLMKIKKFGLRYSYSNYHINSASNHLSISTNLNEWYRK